MARGGDGEITGRMWMTLAAMTISASMILVDQTAVPLATPRAVDDIGGSLDESQWLLTANILPLAAFMVLGGKLGDLFGLRRVFMIGAVIFGVATLGAATAQSMAWMISARVLQGAGAALMMPNSVAIVSGRSRARAGARPSGCWPAGRPGSPRSGRCWAACSRRWTGGSSSS